MRALKKNRGSMGTKAGFGTVAAAGTAVLASACCIVPLVLGAVGIGAAGFGAGLDKYRPVFLVMTPLLLAAAFYMAYRPEQCDASCPAKPGQRRAARIALWLVAPLALATLFLPNIVALGGTSGDAEQVVAEAATGPTVYLRIEGMTCEGCAKTVRKALASVNGVVKASVSLKHKKATVVLKDENVAVSSLIKAVEKAGYKATQIKQDKQ